MKIRQTKKIKGESMLELIVLAGIAFAIIFAVLFAQANFEARAYNRLTGAEVTWQDAFWVQLRVDLPLDMKHAERRLQSDK